MRRISYWSKGFIFMCCDNFLRTPWGWVLYTTLSRTTCQRMTPRACVFGEQFVRIYVYTYRYTYYAHASIKQTDLRKRHRIKPSRSHKYIFPEAYASSENPVDRRKNKILWKYYVRGIVNILQKRIIENKHFLRYYCEQQ